MSQHKIDEFFKHKLDNREFEFDPALWNEAEALLDKNDKRRRNWIWGLLLLIGLAITGSGLWWININSPDTQSVNTDQTLEPTSAIISHKKNSGNNPEHQDEAISNQLLERERSNENKIGSELNDTKAGAFPNRERKKVIVKDATSKPQAYGKQLDNQHTKDINNDTTNSELNPTTEKLIEHRVEEATNIEKTIDRAAEVLPEEKVVGRTKEPSRDKTITGQNAPDEKDAEYSLIPLNGLEFFIATAERPFPGTLLPYKNKIRRKIFTIGVHIGGGLLPGSSDNKWMSNIEGGLNFNYQLNRNWSIGTDLLCRRMSSPSDAFSEISPQIEYGFGKAINTYAFKTIGLHYLEIPVMLQWKADKQLLEFGASLQYLMAVRGEMYFGAYNFPFENNTLSKRDYVSEGEKWITKSGQKNWVPGLVMGYKYFPTDRIWVGGRLHYYPNGISEIIEEETNNVRDIHRVNISVNAGYLFRK